ncbi:2-C-methyl-D-erythritol 4-phosphate cytidylyltransferase [candidate division KSB1 bacterium]|nr:2-C-methyl-D-erythritol 4-phosphate cytidylyltransferase [candidate division KSB1 bacterium]
MFVTAIIPAAGKGLRFGGKVNKQFFEVQGHPILFYTLRAFEASDLIREIILVVPEDWIEIISESVIHKYKFKKNYQILAGGKERYHSVQNGLNAANSQTEIVLIHDAVRPLIRTSVIDRAITACEKFQAVVLGLPLKDTIKIVQDGFVKNTVDRSLLWSIQTPQVFNFELLRMAYQRIDKLNIPVTDDAMLVEASGVPVKIIEGDPINQKITSPEDLEWFEYYLAKLSN